MRERTRSAWSTTTNSSAVPGRGTFAQPLDHALAAHQSRDRVAQRLRVAAAGALVQDAAVHHRAQVPRLERLLQHLVGAGRDGVEALALAQLLRDQHQRQPRPLRLLPHHLGQLEGARVRQAIRDQHQIGPELGQRGQRRLARAREARDDALLGQPARALGRVRAIGVGEQHAETGGALAPHQLAQAAGDAVAVQRRLEERLGARAHREQAVGEVATRRDHQKHGTVGPPGEHRGQRGVQAGQVAERARIEHQRARTRRGQRGGQLVDVRKPHAFETALGEGRQQPRRGILGHAQHAHAVSAAPCRAARALRQGMPSRSPRARATRWMWRATVGTRVPSCLPWPLARPPPAGRRARAALRSVARIRR
jgi:hypothetical protein